MALWSANQLKPRPKHKRENSREYRKERTVEFSLFTLRDDNMPKSLFRDMRGVSEVVASLIIILVVSVAGTVLYSFSIEAFNSSWSAFFLQTKGKEEQAKERLSIIAVWWDNNSQLNLTVLNYGKIELAVDAVYVDGLKATVTEGRGTVIVRQETVQIEFTSPVSIQDGETYEIAVVSQRGSKVAVYWKA
jgi:archaellum component FlaF (FlaF/FlaG flagellin family)